MSSFQENFFEFFQTPRIMGVLNVTPDSFSDGGEFINPKKAVAQATRMIEEGADIIDIGGESSRPGASPVSLEEELERVLPVVKVLKKELPELVISIDTYKPEVAEDCLVAGADMINDITWMGSKDMRRVVSKYKCPVVIMHMQGSPQTMQENPEYKDCVGEIKDFFAERISVCRNEGIDKIILDPGIGFGKTTKHNLEIIQNLGEFKSLGLPILVGASRKSFLGKMLDIESLEDRVNASVVAHMMSLAHGADMLRVHDVREHRQMIDIFLATK